MLQCTFVLYFYAMSSRRNFLNVTHVSGKLSATFQFSNMVESFDGYGVAEVFDVWQKCKPQETEAALHHNKDRRLAAFEAKKKAKIEKSVAWSDTSLFKNGNTDFRLLYCSSEAWPLTAFIANLEGMLISHLT